jgi:hypothetical protein
MQGLTIQSKTSWCEWTTPIKKSKLPEQYDRPPPAQSHQGATKRLLPFMLEISITLGFVRLS